MLDPGDGPADSSLTTSLMAALADQVITVVRAGAEATAVRRARSRLERDAARPLLFTFNAARDDDPALVSDDAARSAFAAAAAPA